MIITTISKHAINTTALPQKVSGRYWLYETEDNNQKRVVSIEGINNDWVLKSNRTYRIYDGNTTSSIKNVAVTPLNIYRLKNINGDDVFVFTEPVTENRQVFTKYLAKGDIELKIGRSENNDIVFANKFVSSNHATIRYINGVWSISDMGSTNGTFVNDMRVSSTQLNIGDTVFIMGMKIVVGRNFIAFNNPDGNVTVTAKLLPFVNQPVDAIDDDEYELPEGEHFYRSPRFKRDIETAQFKIDSPPTSPLTEEMPWLLVMGSSLAMGMMSIVTLASAAATGNIVSMCMGASMLIGTIVLPMITKKYEKKRKREKEELRQRKYREYLNNIAAKINEECRLQEAILNENHVPVSDCESRILGVKRNLWERGYGQNDFLRLRVGRGEGTLDAEINYSERKFTVDDDNLQDELYTLCEKPKTLTNVPVTYSLFDHYVSGVVGERNRVVDFVKGIIFQIAALYSYDEVKLVFLYDECEEKQFEFVKWLPHVWDNDMKFRFIATNNNEVKEVSAYLESIIEYRSNINPTQLEEESPYYIICSFSKDLSVRAEMIKQVLSKKENIHFSVFNALDELKNLPKECSMVVELNQQGGKLYNKNDISGESVNFTPDISLTVDPLDLSVKLANISLDSLASNFKLPKMITFLEMFGAGKVEHLNALNRWQENDPTKSLAAIVGVDTLGDTFRLDLHEKFHGPHGLVAGMTGSGKSEFIITYILSLAVNYHPDEVAFILIDYKGGGMAKSFEKLPHTAGIITNLDGAAIKRSLVSIESELKRRQAIFAKAGKQVGVSNIDIYKYQKLYREGTVSEPLQHLFIISDEFAELKTQQPEFMTQLVSAARIGRSLGVHLILATQKPSGVVDDQIWSNSKFRVCLKVQDRSDSMDMLKRPEAAELTDTGRFYLQVGYNELFELGQSAWAGAPYYPSDKVVVDKDNSVVVIDKNGHAVKSAKLDVNRAKFGDAKKQLDVITEYLRKIAEEEGIKVRPLWLEPIPANILVKDIKNKYNVASERFMLNPLIGEYDDPAHQQQCVLRLPISQEGNVVVYGAAGCGKTTFLNAMVYSLITEHTADEVNIYLLDFASETLRAFAKAPQVGDVILSHEAEKVSNLFKMLQREVEQRKRLFADYGGDYRSYIKASGETLPSIVVAINNFAAFTEMYEEKEEAVSFLAREGTKYGIYFVLTSLGTNGVRFRLLQNFKQLFVLQLNDETEYATVVGKTDGLYPSKFKGRGLFKRDSLFEFQIARVCEDDVPFAFIQQECIRLQGEWNGNSAKKVPILPDVVDVEFLSEYVDTKKPLDIPVGVEKSTLNVHFYPFGDAYITPVMSAGNEYQSFMSDLASLLDGPCGSNGVFFDVPDSSGEQQYKNFTVCKYVQDCENEVAKLFELVLYRNNTYKEALERGEKPEAFDNIVVLIDSLTSLRSTLSDEGKEKLALILEKGTLNYNITIVISDTVKAVSGIAFERWYKTHIDQANGIWIGNGIAEQYQLKPAKLTSEMRAECEAGFGYSIKRGKACKIKLLNTKQEEQDGE